jgi:hypothetical protein
MVIGTLQFIFTSSISKAGDVMAGTMVFTCELVPKQVRRSTTPDTLRSPRTRCPGSSALAVRAFRVGQVPTNSVIHVCIKLAWERWMQPPLLGCTTPTLRGNLGIFVNTIKKSIPGISGYKRSSLLPTNSVLFLPSLKAFLALPLHGDTIEQLHSWRYWRSSCSLFSNTSPPNMRTSYRNRRSSLDVKPSSKLPTIDSNAQRRYANLDTPLHHLGCPTQSLSLA